MTIYEFIATLLLQKLADDLIIGSPGSDRSPNERAGWGIPGKNQSAFQKFFLLHMDHGLFDWLIRWGHRQKPSPPGRNLAANCLGNNPVFCLA